MCSIYCNWNLFALRSKKISKEIIWNVTHNRRKTNNCSISKTTIPCYNFLMTETMQKLIMQIEQLPEPEQDAYALSMLEELGQLEALRKQIDPAIAQLDRGEGTIFEATDSFISRMKNQHGLA